MKLVCRVTSALLPGLMSPTPIKRYGERWNALVWELGRSQQFVYLGGACGRKGRVCGREGVWAFEEGVGGRSEGRGRIGGWCGPPFNFSGVGVAAIFLK